VLSGHGLEVDGARIRITDRAALEAFARLDPVPGDFD
jgi:hypothetical protein